MIRKLALAAAAAAVFALPVRADTPADPYTWLEDIDGQRALDWARAENAKSLPVLERDPRFAAMRAEARAILTSPSRIPVGSIHAGHVYNFWQDDVHVRGIWRRASVDSYRTGTPRWETLVDFDRLARDEEENWVAGEFHCLAPEYRHCMVELSRGGGDTSTWREFDTRTKSFVRQGFAVPEAKSDVAWVDADTLLVGTDWGDGSLTASGYPRVVKVWRRGRALKDASTLMEGRTEDVAVGSFVDQDDGPQPFVVRAVSFFENEYWYTPGLAKPTRLPFPLNTDLQGVLEGRAILSLREPWSYRGHSFPLGAVVAYHLRTGTAELVLAPTETQSIETVAVGKSGLVVQYLDNVSGHAARLTRNPDGAWRLSPIALPENGVI